MTIILLIISLVLRAILSPLLLTYGIIRSITKWELRKWCLEVSIAIDRMGNSLGKYVFNDFFGRGFGNSKETISSRLGKNELFYSLKPLGKLTAWCLNKLDKNHCKNAIDFII